VTTVFLVCAAFGGTILVLQAITTLIGLGGDSFHTDVPHDVSTDLGGDFSGDTGGDLHLDGGGHFHGDTGSDASTDTHVGTADGQHHPSQGHGSSHLFAVLSFRGIVAAMAFFGLGGLSADAMDLPAQTVLLIALACGAAAMYGMYWMMQLLGTLHAEGTVHLTQAVGLAATVYLQIPGARSGAGKIQVNLQNRTMEYLAVTAGDPLATGARVVVVGVVNPETVEVRPLSHCEGDGNE
jgi:hypothetical protein